MALQRTSVPASYAPSAHGSIYGEYPRRVRDASQIEGPALEDVLAANDRGSEGFSKAIVRHSAWHFERIESARNSRSSGVSLACNEAGEPGSVYDGEPLHNLIGREVKRPRGSTWERCRDATASG